MELNVRKVFYDKNPKLARLIPHFLYRYIEHVVHQAELNEFLKISGNKTGVEFARAAIKRFNIHFEVTGLDKVPLNRRYLFVSNHPLGGFDGILLMVLIADHLGDVRVLVNDILMNIKNLETIFLPINKHGGHSKNAALAIDEAFASDVPMLTFPAGLCSRKINGQVIDMEWKKNFIHKAVNFQRNIIPVFFSGRNSEFFYNLSNIRKKTGIKFNIEMLFLADELFKHTNKTFKVTFGKPIGYDQFDRSISNDGWAEAVKNFVYSLADNPDAIFHPIIEKK